MMSSNGRRTYMTTFVRPAVEARPNEDVDRIYVTENDLDDKSEPMWDLAGFPHLYRVAAEFSEEGVLTDIASECLFLAGVLRDLPLGGALRVDESVEIINQLMGVAIKHISQQNAPALSERCEIDEKGFCINTELVEPFTQTHLIEVKRVNGGQVMRVAMTREQACLGLEMQPTRPDADPRARPRP
nr:hypothetical protein 13 [bacterium]